VHDCGVVQSCARRVKAFRARVGKEGGGHATASATLGRTGTYYLASAFDEVFVQPSGGRGRCGPVHGAVFVRGALEKLWGEGEHGTRTNS
jgi:protease-4